MASAPFTVDDLFARALINLDADHHPSRDNPTGRSAIALLQRTGTRETLDTALLWREAADPLRRRVCADVLGQLGHDKPGFEPVFVEERLSALIDLLEHERSGSQDPQVLSDTCIAIGHLHDARAIPFLLRLADHANPDVRYGVTCAVGGHDTPEAISGLIRLSADANDDVRDCATFGLGQLIKTDTPQVRSALHARLKDPCADVRNEAIEGLATRGDRSVMPALIRELHQQVSIPLLDAAAALATPDLCEALAAAAERGLVWYDNGHHDLTDHWDEARRSCGC